jgi:hypothetical protein
MPKAHRVRGQSGYGGGSPAYSHGEHTTSGALSTIINKDGAAFFTVLVNFC